MRYEQTQSNGDKSILEGDDSTGWHVHIVFQAGRRITDGLVSGVRDLWNAKNKSKELLHTNLHDCDEKCGEWTKVNE